MRSSLSFQLGNPDASKVKTLIAGSIAKCKELEGKPDNAVWFEFSF